MENAYVQEEFFDRLELILDIETTSTGWEDDMALAVAEIFADNEKLSLELKPKQVQQLMELLKRFHDSSPELLVTIRTLVKCEELDVPLPRNQNLVMKFLMRSFDELVGRALIDVTSDAHINSERMALLRYKGTDPAVLTKQLYHVNLVGLLAHCAEGYNRFIESTCMTLFQVDEVILVLQDKGIPVRFKTEYLLFLYFVYLETAVGSVESGTGDLQNNAPLWSAMLMMARELNGLFRSEAPYLNPWEERFAFDAFLPVFTHLVKEHYNSGNKAIARTYVAEIFTIIKDLASRSVERLYTKEQVHELSAAIVALQTVGAGVPPQDLLERLSNRMQLVEGDIAISHEAKVYEERFKRQIELNNMLNEFAKRVQTAYGGENKIRVQLPKGTDNPDIIDREYCEGEVR